MFGSLFQHTNNMFGHNGGQNNPTPQSAGSGTTPTSQAADPNKKKWGWPKPGGAGGAGGGTPNNSQWPTSWPHWGHQGGGTTTPPATTPPATTPPAPTPTPSVTYPAGSWQSNWESAQTAQLAGMPEARRAAEMARDQQQRQWYERNKTAGWFEHIERLLAQRYKNPAAPGTPPGTPGGGGTPPPAGGGGGGTPPPANAAAYTPGTFDRDPRPFT